MSTSHDFQTIIWLTFSALIAFSSALENPVKDLPKNMDFPSASTAPTAALDHDESSLLPWWIQLTLFRGRWPILSCHFARTGRRVEYHHDDVTDLNIPLMPI